MGLKKRYIWIIVAYLVASYATLFLDLSTVLALTEENRWFEIAGSTSFLVGGFFFFLAFLRSRNAENRRDWTTINRLFLLGVAIVLVFGGGEEASWGQQYFGWETPEPIAEQNEQDETNVHNLTWVSFSLLSAFNVFWACFALVVPVLAALYEPARRFFRKLVPIVPWMLGVLVVVNYLLSKLAGYIILNYTEHLPEVEVVPARVEIQEANLAFLTAVTAIYVFTVMMKPSPDPKGVVSAAHRGGL